MSQTVTSDATITLNVYDQYTSDTVASAGDVIQFQEAVVTYYGGSPLPTVGLEWSAALTFVASTPQTFDLTNLTGPRGSTVTFASVRIVYIINLASTSGYALTFGNPGSNAWYAPFNAATVTRSIPMGSRLFLENADLSTPWTVNSTNKLIKLDPGSNALTARIIVIGS